MQLDKYFSTKPLPDESHSSAGGAAFALLKIAERNDTLQRFTLQPNVLFCTHHMN